MISPRPAGHFELRDQTTSRNTANWAQERVTQFTAKVQPGYLVE